MITIILLDKKRTEVLRREVEPQHINEAACIVWRGRYFVYNGLDNVEGARTFSMVARFGEVDSPYNLAD